MRKIDYVKSTIIWTMVIIVQLRAGTPTGDKSDFTQDWRWVHFTVESGLPSDLVQEVFESLDSTVWVGTTLGLAWFDGFQWVSIDPTRGIPSDASVRIVGELGDSLVVSTGRQYYIGTKQGFH